MLTVAESQKRLSAALSLCSDMTLSREKITSLRTLIEGINPKVDKHLAECDAALSTVTKIQDGEIVQLTAEHLPENTDDEKKYKRALLLLISLWKNLRTEIVRVQGELGSPDAKTDGGNTWLRIVKGAKGPLGLVTLVAVGVALMYQSSVVVTLHNDGCGTMVAHGAIPISLPGLSLPNEAIQSGDSADITIPGIPLTANGTDKGSLQLSSVGFSFSIQLPSTIRDVTFDGTSLLGKVTDLNLSGKDTHSLIVQCR